MQETCLDIKRVPILECVLRTGLLASWWWGPSPFASKAKWCPSYCILISARLDPSDFSVIGCGRLDLHLVSIKHFFWVNLFCYGNTHSEKVFFIRKIVLSEERQFRGSRIGIGNSWIFSLCSGQPPLFQFKWFYSEYLCNHDPGQEIEHASTLESPTCLFPSTASCCPDLMVTMSLRFIYHVYICRLFVFIVL